MTTREKFYLDKRSGKILGVCAGIANYTGLDVLWIRVGVVIAALMGWGLPVLAYVVIALLASTDPATQID